LNQRPGDERAASWCCFCIVTVARFATQLGAQDFKGLAKDISKIMMDAVTTLIIDDSADSRKWLRQRLESVGCVVVGEAESPVGGLERFEALRPRLVTLDIVMPEIDGMTAIELLRRIKREDPEIAVLVISGRPTATAHDFLKLGAIAYLEKPFIDFADAARLLRAYFPELGIKGAVAGKRGGLSARLADKA
jgi:two-component system chemotaxis response regulator CheY